LWGFDRIFKKDGRRLPVHVLPAGAGQGDIASKGDGQRPSDSPAAAAAHRHIGAVVNVTETDPMHDFWRRE